VSIPVEDDFEVRFPQMLGDLRDLDHADAFLVGIPFDGGTVGGRPGSRLAPKEIRASFIASRTYEPHLRIDISEFPKVVDAGDVSVAYTDVQTTIERARTVLTHMLRRPGGSHSNGR